MNKSEPKVAPAFQKAIILKIDNTRNFLLLVLTIDIC